MTITYARIFRTMAAVTLLAALVGCRPAVTGQNIMPDDPNMSPAQKRQAMIKYHQQHDKNPAAAPSAKSS